MSQLKLIGVGSWKESNDMLSQQEDYYVVKWWDIFLFHHVMGTKQYVGGVILRQILKLGLLLKNMNMNSNNVPLIYWWNQPLHEWMMMIMIYFGEATFLNGVAIYILSKYREGSFCL